MFGRKKDPKPPSRRAGQSLAQYGLFDVPDNLDDMGGPSDEGDSDLEAELAAIAGAGGRAKSKPKPKARALPQVDLDNLVAASLRDIPSDEEMSDGDEDPDLLNELSELAGEEPAPEAPVPSRPAPPPPGPPAASGAGEQVALLKERIQMYTLAEENAKSSGESSRARRLNRGIKTLKDQLKQAMAGKIVNEEDIPPAVSTSKHTTPAPAPPPLTNETEDIKAELPEPPQPAALTPESPKQATPPPAEEPSAVNELSDEAKATLNVLNERKNQYKLAALTAKREGDNALALSYVKILKEFDRVGGAVRAGQAVDLSNMPGPPGEAPPGPPPLPLRQEEHVQMSTDDPSAVSEDTISTNETLISASSIEEALQQRLDLYRQQESVAKEAGNTSKARRMGRIVKQFEGAMKQHRAGRAIPYDELPTPPGYAPIPGAPPPPKEDPAPETSEAQPPPASDESPAPEASGGPRTGAPGTAGRSNSVRRMGNQLGTGLASQQLTALLQRQREFKEAALEAKKKGELSEAKEFLRCAKGFDPLIDAARGGLPVDLSSVPIPPQAKQQLEDSYDIINSEDCGEGQEEGVLGRLEQQLAEQLRLCLETGEHHRAMGDVSGANRFQHLALAVKQDIDVVKMAKRLGSKSVKFHYETKQFSIVQCCTDLGDNDLELTIVRGISYTVPNPKEIDTYVKFEFPYPQEEPVQDKTALVKDTNSPEYNAVFTIPIHRTRPCLRIFKRQAVKLELYSRGGFFSRDTLIATATVKLQPLETQTVLHDSFDLMNGRKLVGGKLEVKIRVRNPMLTKQIEQSTKKWLIIDH